MQTTSKQTGAPAAPTAAEVVSTSAAPRVLSTTELAAVTGAGVMVGNKAGVCVGG